MKKIVVLLILSSVFFSCNTNDSNSLKEKNLKNNNHKVVLDSNTIIKSLPPLPETPPIEELPEEFYLKIVKPKNIELEYSISELDNFSKKDSKRLLCSLKNLNDFPIYLLEHSCTFIPGELILEPSSVTCWQDFDCNASYPMITKIESNTISKFSTNIRIKKKSELKNLDLKVRFVNRYETFEFLKEHPEILNTIYNTPIDKCSYLKGKLKS